MFRTLLEQNRNLAHSHAESLDKGQGQEGASSVTAVTIKGAVSPTKLGFWFSNHEVPSETTEPLRYSGGWGEVAGGTVGERGLRPPPRSLSAWRGSWLSLPNVPPPEWGLPFLAIESLFSVGSGRLWVRGQSSASMCSGGGRATASPPLRLNETCLLIN